MKVTAAGMMLLLGVVLGSARAALAQGATRTLTGIVVDSAAHKPISQAAIYVGRTATEQHTANDGTFRVTATEDALLLMIRRPGYIPAVVPVPGDTTGAEMDLGTTNLRRLKTDADRAAAQVLDIAVYPELARFYDHKAGYRQGLFWTPDDLERVGGSLFTLIRQKPGFEYICFRNRKGETDCGMQPNRGPTSIMNPRPTSAEREPCQLEVWTDGLRSQRTLDDVLVREVLAVEAYRNLNPMPAELAGSPCATIVLWMKETGPGLPPSRFPG